MFFKSPVTAVASGQLNMKAKGKQARFLLCVGSDDGRLVLALVDSDEVGVYSQPLFLLEKECLTRKS